MHPSSRQAICSQEVLDKRALIKPGEEAGVAYGSGMGAGDEGGNECGVKVSEQTVHSRPGSGEGDRDGEVGREGERDIARCGGVGEIGEGEMCGEHGCTSMGRVEVCCESDCAAVGEETMFVGVDRAAGVKR